MINYYLEAFTKNYANFDGRARRSEYWYFTLFNVLVYVLILMIGVSSESPMSMILLAVYSLATLVPNIAIVVRRLHDIGKSGWYYFVSFIPIIGGIWLLVLLCTDSQHGENEYGSNPKGIGNLTDDSQIGQIGQGI